MKAITYEVNLKEEGIEVIQNIDLGDVPGEPKSHTGNVFFKTEEEFFLFKKMQIEELEDRKAELDAQLKEVKSNLENLETLVLD